MKQAPTRAVRRLFRKSHPGQSLVILAIGFLALIGFVGIVTDVSLLFVRFSTLRRAVDAAAVAAAGQMRRIEDTTPVNGIAEDQATSFANMNLAARQFIEFYGLSPSEVIVETCHAQNRNVAAGRDASLCTADERKLVRVTAQIESPTTFFSLFGFRTIRLQASSTSETAVLDMVFIMDVSESMLEETTYDDWLDAGFDYAYLPPVLPEVDSTNFASTVPMWRAFGQASQNTIMSSYGTWVDMFGTNAGRRIQQIQIPGATSPFTAPRADCQVRFWPASTLKATLTSDEVNFYLNNYFGNNLTNFRSWFLLDPGMSEAEIRDGDFPGPMWRGFVPQYKFYGCCNDPNGDTNMSDLLCQPFRRARDASVDFMERIDFIRGDRVAIVTFDRRVYLMDPNPNNDARDAMLDNQQLASDLMQQAVGVRTETSFYADQNRDARWDAFLSNGAPRDYMNSSGSWFNTTPVGQIVDHPVRDACPMDMAMLTYPYSLYLDIDGLNEGNEYTDYRMGANPAFPQYEQAPLDVIDTIPSWYTSISPREPRPTGNAVAERYNTLRRSYEWVASCAGTNMGDGLGRASQTLGQVGRREGAVWIMVLLSDGAAGASAPAVRNGTGLTVPQPYNTTGASNGGTNPIPTSPSINVQYGVYGVCPYGTQSSPGELLQDTSFPRCSDLRPETRNFCNDSSVPADPSTVGPNRIELTDSTACVERYDVDDYARDWADYVAVRGINVYQQSVTTTGSTASEALLPTIFTIGFGLEFVPPPTGLTCDNVTGTGNNLLNCNIQPYLGEELLRYIADAGDNFRIDNDYWQQVLGYRIPNRVADLVTGQTPDWGPRGACETSNGTRGTWSPLTPGADCGNYWSASTGGSELEEVFTEIAARMFTRLAG